jgi:hypothetical protein
VQFCSRPSYRAVLNMFVDVWEGLNVRLAISEGETATWSGQMSITLHKRRAWLLQGGEPGGRGVHARGPFVLYALMRSAKP